MILQSRGEPVDWVIILDDIVAVFPQESAVNTCAFILISGENFTALDNLPGTDQNKQTTNQNSLFGSLDWLSANQGPVSPGSVPAQLTNSITCFCGWEGNFHCP
eukprot:sb/3478103/